MQGRAHTQPHADYFQVTHRSANHLALFANPSDYREFLAGLAAALAEHPVRLIAYALMPTRWHLVVGPASPSDLSRALSGLGATQKTPAGSQAHYEAVPGVDDLFQVCRRVERAALDRRLVHRAQDWPWCSLTNRLHGVTPVPLVDAPFLSSRTWVDYVNDDGLNTVRPDRSAARLHHVTQSPGRFA